MNLMYVNYILNIFELPERKVESKSPCLVYKPNMFNVGFT